MSRVEAPINAGPQPDTSSSSPQNSETITPYTPTFNDEQAGLAVMFLEIEERSLQDHGIAPLPEEMIDGIYLAAGETIKPNGRPKEERQLDALHALQKISDLPQASYTEWVKAQSATVGSVTAFGRNLKDVVFEDKDGSSTNLLDDMTTKAANKLERLKVGQGTMKSVGKLV